MINTLSLSSFNYSLLNELICVKVRLLDLMLGKLDEDLLERSPFDCEIQNKFVFESKQAHLSEQLVETQFRNHFRVRN